MNVGDVQNKIDKQLDIIHSCRLACSAELRDNSYCRERLVPIVSTELIVFQRRLERITEKSKLEILRLRGMPIKMRRLKEKI